MSTDRWKPRLVLLVVLSLLAACRNNTGPHGDNDCDATHCLLFVGGSLTWENDMPGMLEALVASSGRSIRIGTSYMGGSTLGDHLQAGDAERMIRTRAFDIVVLEQGPSSRPENRALLRQWTAEFNAIIRAAGGTPALSMTWPMRENVADFPASSESYHLAAQDVNGILFAIGDAWRAAWRVDPTIELYGPDGWHPSPNASYLGALVIYGKLYNQSVRNLPSDFTTATGLQVHIDAAVASVLKGAADEVNSARASLDNRVPR